MSDEIFKDGINERFADYLRDESRRTGVADSISFPETEQDIIQIITHTEGPITVQGARTGITAGAVPESGHILNMSRMTKILGMRMVEAEERVFSIIVQPGLTLADLRAAVVRKEFYTESWDDESISVLTSFQAATDYFFPPDPTEDTASIGGMIACNASGARSFKYGPTRDYVGRVRLVSADGEIIEVRRGQRAVRREFTVDAGARTYKGRLPSYSMPNVKNASGYYSADDMDLIDLFIGSEGTLGVVSEAELMLFPSPAHNWAIMAFFPSTDTALDFVAAARGLSSPALSALEFFDENAISLLRNQKKDNPAFSFLPEMKEEWHTCIYVELDGVTENTVEAVAVQLAEIIESSGCPETATWMATEASEMDRMKKFRHALPEAVNLTIDTYRKTSSDITKLGTDFAVPDNCLRDIVNLYKTDLVAATLEYVIFGHIGNNHIHVNILPRNMNEYAEGKRLYLKWAKQVVAMGGTVSAEHGIGKLKTDFLAAMFGDDGVKEMKAVKAVFDPESRLNPGNLFKGIQ